MTVRAKFFCQTVEEDPTNDGYTVTLYPVTDGSAENDQFFRWTPGGQITISTVNRAAAAEFEEGTEYYVDFIKAD